MKQAKYDVFVSYRRSAYDTANLIAVKLRHAGYKVFFDVDTLTAGKFNEQLLEVIKSCKDFILVLPEKALDRCHQQDDWIRRETVCALENHRNIIPVLLDGFSWPQEMPEGMEELRNYQAVTAVGHEYFDMAMERLKSYLKSKPSKLSKNLLTWIGAACAILILCLGIAGYIGYRMSKTICTEACTQLSSSMGALDMLGDLNKDLEVTSSKFFSKAQADNPEETQEWRQELLKEISQIETEAERYHQRFPAPQFGISSFQNAVLDFLHVNKEELMGFSTFYDSMYDDLKDNASTLIEALEGNAPSTLAKSQLQVQFNCFRYSLNAIYYAYMQQLSLFPRDCLKAHHQLSSKWKNYPNGIALGLSSEEYDNFQMNEMARLDAEIKKLSDEINYESEQIDN